MAREPGDALQHAHQVRTEIRTGESMDLVDHHDPQVAEQLGFIHPLRDEHHL
jgi:hypothetical protein